VDISCILPPGSNTPDHIELAEQLGYTRAWCFDTPTLCADVWVTLAVAAERTTHIGLATGMAIPGLRHAATTASAAATLAGLAPGRFTLGVGSGLTARRLLGKRAHRWADVVEYVEAVRALLRHEKVLLDGTIVQLRHPTVQHPTYPIDIPVVAAVEGKVGIEAARRMKADGVATNGPVPDDFGWGMRVTFGTVLDPGESRTADRVLAAAGPGAALFYHLTYDMAGEAVDEMPGGAEWRRALEALPAEERHLAHWDGHLVELNAIDRATIPPEVVAGMTLVGTAEEVRSRVTALAAEGVTEIGFTPAGDIPAELRRFADALCLKAQTSTDHSFAGSNA
jgi:5,10-methylenetetrahydromethanopterin reductase